MNAQQAVRRAVNIDLQCEGRFKMEAVRPDGSRRFLAEFPNLITNAGLNNMGEYNGFLSYCHVGSGNTAPANGDTALVSQVAETSQTVGSALQTAQPSSPYYGSVIRTHRFDAGTATGNLSEVGMSPGPAGSFNLTSRALILDGSGNPTTITVLADEALDVTYEFRIYPPTGNVTGNISLDGNNYAYTIRAANVTQVSSWGHPAGGARMGFGGNGNSVSAYDGAIGATIVDQPTGDETGYTSDLDHADYSAGTYQRSATVTFGLVQANLADGIAALLIPVGQGQNCGSMQVGFSPAIPKTNAQVLALTFRVSWSRRSIP